MPPRSTNDAEALALSALAASLTDERRAQRFLDLSGIDTVDLRHRLGDPQLLAALLRFLEAHEPDLIQVAEAVGVAPAELVAAREALEA
jgi:adenine/guanine phosphoribosyltransferase-like PRPP-binding protein